MKRGRNVLKRVFGFLLFTFLLFPCVIKTDAAEKIKENQKVLFISSYSYTWSTVPLQIGGISSQLPEYVSLDIEFMDTKTLPLDISKEQLLERLRSKESHGQCYDAVIVGDDAALLFAMENRAELFKGIPIVFEGINNLEYAREVSKDPLVTGVIECGSYQENIDFALTIQPNADRIVAIVDDTVTGVGEQQQFFDQQEFYPQLSFDVINSSKLNRDQLIKEISKLDEKSILVYLILSEDVEGNFYTNEQVCHLIEEYAKIPALRFVQAGIGDGVLGGNIVLHDESGAIAARMVMEILSGKDPGEVSMQEESPNGFCLDQNILDKFKISPKLVPQNSRIINQKISFWEEHGKVIMVTAGFATVLMLGLLFGTRAIYEHRRSKELAESNRQLERAVQIAEEASGAKSQFLAQMSHEIRTPMNAIIGLTTIAKTEMDNQQKMREYLTKIENSSHLLLSLINDILDMSAIERGKMKLDQSVFDFKKQLSGIVSMFYQQTKQKNICFNIHMNGVTEERIIGDELRVNQIMMNLLSNAVKFTPEGGNIDFTIIQTSRSQGKVYFRFIVKDTGCGMSEDMMNRLFHPFEQEDGSTARKHGGSGLGLSITKSLAEMMGGSIRAESALGQGSTFVVDIPFIACEQNYDQSENFEDIRTLVVDDDEDACKYCGILLERLGVRYDYVTEGEAALEALGEAEDAGDPYRLCIIDWQMPAMDGVEVTKQINSIFGNDSVLVLASAFDLNEIMDAGKEAGADYFIAKPLFQSTLHDVLVRIAGKEIKEDAVKDRGRFDFTGKKVLVAEDVELNMEVAVKFLHMVGIEVSCAENGQKALEMYEQSVDGFYDCILMDINMPQMDGYEATRAIRKSNKPDASTVPIYAMTANAYAEDVTAAMDAGMNGHLSKPIEVNILYETLQEVFEQNEQI